MKFIYMHIKLQGFETYHIMTHPMETGLYQKHNIIITRGIKFTRLSGTSSVLGALLVLLPVG